MNIPIGESLKEVWRWFYSFVLSGLFTSLISLIVNALPFFPVKIFPETVVVVGFSLPLRFYIQGFVLPVVVRALDKYKFYKSKEKVRVMGESPEGLPGFNLFNNVI